MSQAAVEKVKQKLEDRKADNGGVLSIEELIRQSSKQLGMAMPAHMNPERLTRIALTTLRLNPKLYQCEPMSFLAALFQSAQLGLEPNVNGEAWIIPYSNKGVLMAQFQVGYLGFIKLFWNHQSAVSIQMETIHKNDHFSCDLGSNELSHKLPPLGDERGNVVGYYALAHLQNGGRAFKVISKDEALKFAKKFSKCFDQRTNDFYSGTPWKEHFDAMAMKTVLKQLMKLLPKSVEIQHALAMDETVKTKIDGDMVQIPDETDFKELSAPAGDGLEKQGEDGAPKTTPSGMSSASSSTNSAPAKRTALEIKIFGIRDDLKKLMKTDDFYYQELGKLGGEHLHELKPLNQEVLLKILSDKLKAFTPEA